MDLWRLSVMQKFFIAQSIQIFTIACLSWFCDVKILHHPLATASNWRRRCGSIAARHLNLTRISRLLATLGKSWNHRVISDVRSEGCEEIKENFEIFSSVGKRVFNKRAAKQQRRKINSIVLFTSSRRKTLEKCGKFPRGDNLTVKTVVVCCHPQKN